MILNKIDWEEKIPAPSWQCWWGKHDVTAMIPFAHFEAAWMIVLLHSSLKGRPGYYGGQEQAPDYDGRRQEQARICILKVNNIWYPPPFLL